VRTASRAARRYLYPNGLWHAPTRGAAAVLQKSARRTNRTAAARARARSIHDDDDDDDDDVDAAAEAAATATAAAAAGSATAAAEERPESRVVKTRSAGWSFPGLLLFLFLLLLLLAPPPALLCRSSVPFELERGRRRREGVRATEETQRLLDRQR